MPPPTQLLPPTTRDISAIQLSQNSVFVGCLSSVDGRWHCLFVRSHTRTHAPYVPQQPRTRLRTWITRVTTSSAATPTPAATRSAARRRWVVAVQAFSCKARWLSPSSQRSDAHRPPPTHPPSATPTPTAHSTCLAAVTGGAPIAAGPSPRPRAPPSLSPESPPTASQVCVRVRQGRTGGLAGRPDNPRWCPACQLSVGDERGPYLT
jgi:hypothetical protein